MNFENSSDSSDALFSLIEEIKLGYQPPEEVLRRGRKPDFSPLSFLLLAVVAVVTKTFSDSELRRFLEKDRELRARLGFSRTPHRTQIMRRLKSLVPTAEEQVSWFGKQILREVPISEANSEVSATDGRMYQALGPLWHKKHRQAGLIPTGLEMSMLNQVGQNQTIVDGSKAIESSCKHWSFRCLFHFWRSGVRTPTTKLKSLWKNWEKDDFK